MIYFVVVDTTEENRVAKYQEYPTRAEADAHVVRFASQYPNAFVVDNPDPSPAFSHIRRHTTVDVEAKTITYDSAGFDAQKVKDNAQVEIERLEGTVTARRRRDAVASDEGKAWIANVEEKIQVERDKL